MHAGASTDAQPATSGAPSGSAVLSPAALFDEDMDLRDREDVDALDHGPQDELEELFALLAESLPEDVGDGDFGGGGGPAPDLPDEQTAAEVAEGLAQVMSGIDTGEEAQPANEASSSSAAADEVNAAPAPIVDERWRDLGPVTDIGYVYDSTPRSVLRIQRGKPKNSVTINCYKHPGCRLLLTEARCPDDDGLKRWLFEVPPAAPGSSRDEAKRLAETHMALGKGRWGGAKQR